LEADSRQKGLAMEIARLWMEINRQCYIRLVLYPEAESKCFVWIGMFIRTDKSICLSASTCLSSAAHTSAQLGRGWMDITACLRTSPSLTAELFAFSELCFKREIKNSWTGLVETQLIIILSNSWD
jgi:hypothetical protein